MGIVAHPMMPAVEGGIVGEQHSYSVLDYCCLIAFGIIIGELLVVVRIH